MTVPPIDAARPALPKIDRPNVESVVAHRAVHYGDNPGGQARRKENWGAEVKQQTLICLGVALRVLFDGVAAAQTQKIFPICASLPQIQVST
jgi:hypothetical protein